MIKVKMSLQHLYIILFIFCNFVQGSPEQNSGYNTNKLTKHKECFIQSSKQHGICTYAFECPGHTVTKNYTICQNDRLQSKICCPSLNFKLRKSRKACDRYKEIVVWKPNQKLEHNRNIYPHLAVIGWLVQNDKLHWYCGGSLISDKFVLSAAHCITNFKKVPNVVRFSEYDLAINKLNEYYNILKVIIHPGFKKQFHIYNDIALIELKDFLSLRTYLRPVCLAQHNTEFSPSLYTNEIGYGFTNKNDHQIKLHQNRVIRISEQSCGMGLQLTNTSLIPNGLISSQMCYRTIANDLVSCADYIDRSLLVRQTINNSFVYGIVGVFSFCRNGQIRVFTDVSKYIDWIESIVWPE